MPDIFSNEKRGEIMSKIPSKNTEPEKKVRKLIRSLNYGYRLNVKKLPGKPDIVVSKAKTAIFVNGCFWHSHNKCKRGKLPSSNTEFWRNKITSNIAREKKVLEKLKQLGWKTLILWQCELNNTDNIRRRLLKYLKC